MIFEQGNTMYQRHIEVEYPSVMLYPFGRGMKGSAISGSTYRYVYNGKEKEARSTANDCDFGATMFDVRLVTKIGLAPVYLYIFYGWRH